MDPVRELLAAACAAYQNAHAPYSDFPVGAAIRAASGRIYVGCNVENASYPVGTCAEAGAIAAMVVAGDTRISEIAVIGARRIVTPCGACRQRIAEFGDAATRIHCSGPGQATLNYTLGDLLPHAFGPANATGTLADKEVSA